jgi:pyruvate formate lyase activating enzyme
MIFDVKRYAIHDGPGIRTTLFLKGCPLGCPWCQNPEGRSPAPELIWRGRHCLGCEDCLEDCPEGALSTSGNGLFIDRTICNTCGDCVSRCPSGALEMIGRRITVHEAMAEIEKDLVFYDESGGGVTFSGGEPFMQPEFLADILRACRQRGIATAVDTSGYVRNEVMLGMLDDIDLLLWDLKIMDDAMHRKLTGVSNRMILENLRTVAEMSRPTIVRFSLIPGMNADEANVKALGEFVSSTGGLGRVDILPYHKAGLGKAALLGRGPGENMAESPGESRDEDGRKIAGPFALEVPTLEALESVRDHLAGLGLEVRIGG